MDILKFDSKPDAASDADRRLPDVTIHACIQGGSIVVPDEAQGKSLEKVGYGHRLGDRQDRISIKNFGEKMEDDSMNLEARKWLKLSPLSSHLRLSPEEAYYLGFDQGILSIHEDGEILEEPWSRLRSLGGPEFIRRAAVYRHLKKLGWCVRSGLTFGCHFLIYRSHPEQFHASAAVLITDDLTHTHFMSLTRMITNQRKALIVASLVFPESFDEEDPNCLVSISIELLTAVSFFPNRGLEDTVD